MKSTFFVLASFCLLFFGRRARSTWSEQRRQPIPSEMPTFRPCFGLRVQG